MRDVVSYSELATLAICEMKWAYRYRDRTESEPTLAMRKGTAVHELAGTWWTGDDEALRGRLLEVEQSLDPETWADTQWLFDRYTRHYGRARNGGAIRVIDTEHKLLRPIPGTDVQMVTYVDAIVKTTTGLWVVERKTMKDWQRLELLEVDPQITIELWQARTAGWPVQGVMYDAIRTYRWKPEKPTQKYLMETEGLTREQAKEQIELHPGIERPDAESFQLLYPDRSSDEVDEALADIRSAVRRRAVLGAGERPIRNLGQACNTCPFKAQCWDEAAFGAEVVLEQE